MARTPRKTSSKPKKIKETSKQVEEPFSDEELGRKTIKNKKKEVSNICARCGENCENEKGRKVINDVRYCSKCYEKESDMILKRMLDIKIENAKRKESRW